MKDHVHLNIQIVQCKPEETCYPAKESQFYGMGLGYVYEKWDLFYFYTISNFDCGIANESMYILGKCCS